jgi:hypothetical protein
MVYQLKSIACLFSNPHASEQPVLLALRENRNLTIEDYYELFCQLIAIVDSFGMVLCLITADNLPVQVNGLDCALQMNGSPAIHVKWFAHMTNLVFASTVSPTNFSWIMNYLADLQQLLRSPFAGAEPGIKRPKSVRTRWFSRVSRKSCRRLITWHMVVQLQSPTYRHQERDFPS